jgi:hypothetical protein
MPQATLPAVAAHGAMRLPSIFPALHALIPDIDGEETAIVMHNDAVVQGLSEVPRMADIEHWGVLTIGTGLGNARFTNRKLGDG